MTNIDITAASQALHTERDRLFSELSELAVYNETTDDFEAIMPLDNGDDADDNLHGDSLESAEERIATLALLETKYRNVVAALQKIDAGTYGICEIGGEPIELNRLHANPAARTCQIHMEEEGFLALV
jgi:RNA polymerase-binding transcription factor DksA